MQRDELVRRVPIDYRGNGPRFGTVTVTDAEALDAIGRAKSLRRFLANPCEDCGGANCINWDWCRGLGWMIRDELNLDTSATDYSRRYVLVPLDWLEDTDGPA